MSATTCRSNGSASASRRLQRVDNLMARQGHMIETVAINQLKARRERLVAQQTQARYAVADSYDRAARAQSGGGGAVMRRLALPMLLAPLACRLRRAPDKGTLAELHNVRPDVQEAKVEQGLDRRCSATGASSKKRRKPR